MINFLDRYFGRFGNRMFQLASLYAMYRDGKIPDIYLQDFRNFDFYKDEIKKMFGEFIVPSDYISIHVRRGANPSVPTEPNYSHNPYYANLCDSDYYQKAMEQFPNEKFMFFSDDLNWCYENFGYDKEKFIYASRTNNEIEDWNMMAGCKGHIIANSSYSFMAAYIGGGKTVAPSKWFANGTRIPYPNDWIIV